MNGCREYDKGNISSTVAKGEPNGDYLHTQQAEERIRGAGQGRNRVTLGMIKARQTAELPVVVKWGRLLLRGSLAALVVGGAGLKAFAPDRRGQGLDPVSLIILLPIWGCCLAGTILSLWGWVRYPCLESELDLDVPARSDRRFFGPSTKSLACFTLLLVWLSTFVLLAEPDAEVPLWKTILTCYCSTAYCWFFIYLATLYSPVKHRPTTTYLNNLGPLIGVLMVPLTWFLLVGLNVGQVE